jgi:hypothetical protein
MDMHRIVDDRLWRRAIAARRAYLDTLRIRTRDRVAIRQAQTVDACQQFAEADACARKLLDWVASSGRAYHAARASED